MINDGTNIFNITKLKNKFFEKNESQRVYIKREGLYRKEIGEKVSNYRKLGESILTEHLKKEPLNFLKIDDKKVIKNFFENYIYSDVDMDVELLKLKKLQRQIEKQIKIVEEDIKDRNLQNLNI